MPIGGNFDSEKRQLEDWKYELGSKDKAKAYIEVPKVSLANDFYNFVFVSKGKSTR